MYNTITNGYCTNVNWNKCCKCHQCTCCCGCYHQQIIIQQVPVYISVPQFIPVPQRNIFKRLGF